MYRIFWLDVTVECDTLDEVVSLLDESSKRRRHANGWINWYGGECPVSDETIVEYRMKDGGISTCEAGHLRWDSTGLCGDIIAYRVIKC